MVATNEQLDDIASYLAGKVATIAVGTDGTAETKTDTTIGNQVFSGAATVTSEGIGEKTFSVRLQAADADGDDLKEIVLLDSGGNLLARKTFAVISKTNNFELEFEYTEEVANA